MESGADLSIVDGYQWNALWYSLDDISAKGTLVFTYLLESGINVSQINSDSYSHLHTCASIIYLDKYLQLLDFGIDSSVRNEDGETAIDILLTSISIFSNGLEAKVHHKVAQLFEVYSLEQRLEHERDIIGVFITMWKINGFDL